MKKILIILAITILGLTSCTNDAQQTTEETAKQNETRLQKNNVFSINKEDSINSSGDDRGGSEEISNEER